MQIINTRLITHPMNWAIVILMLVLAAIGGHLLMTFFDQEPATGSDGTPQGLTVEQMEPNAQSWAMGSLTSSQ